jgi:glucose-6-phosphate 1-dehydrogenase
MSATMKVLGAGDTLTIIIFGATGDLAKRKLFPALYQLMYACPDAPLLPVMTRIVGYGRSAMKLEDFIGKQCGLVQGSNRSDFLKQVSYFQGKYDVEEDFGKLHAALLELEGSSGTANRLFFLSIPPTAFACVCKNIHLQACAANGLTRVIIEKPFGRDSRTFAELNSTTSGIFREDQIFRIDHYLAKENVLNLLVARFANQIYEPLLNRHQVAQVEIVWKEDIGTEGRGGYFNEFGIIRDMMQNHLLQIFQWLAMEPPERLHAEHIAKEKRRLLHAVRTLSLEDCFLGQYGPGDRKDKNGDVHAEVGYLEDSTVPAGSRCPTFAAVALTVENERWRGVPFLMRAGKALNERLAEVVITFKRQDYNSLVPSEPNQLVFRIQPDEGIFFKCINKRPGWKQTNTAPVQMDMSYDRAFPGSYNAGAYERMLLNASTGDQSLFVGSEELVEAWRIFTPLLDEIDAKQPLPVRYPFGARAPDGFANFCRARGIVCEEASEHYYLPKFIRGIPVLVQEAEDTWRADNSRLGSHNGGLCFRKSTDMADRAQEDFLLMYGTTTKGIDIGNNWVKVPYEVPLATGNVFGSLRGDINRARSPSRWRPDSSVRDPPQSPARSRTPLRGASIQPAELPTCKAKGGQDNFADEPQAQAETV